MYNHQVNIEIKFFSKNIYNIYYNKYYLPVMQNYTFFWVNCISNAIQVRSHCIHIFAQKFVQIFRI